MAISIVQIATPSEIEAVKDLVRELTEFALTQLPQARQTHAFQGLEVELAGLPGIFGPPGGAFLLASVDGSPAGCVAIRKHDDAACEVKRMYVRPSFRGYGLGEALVDALITKARELGYRHIVLDSFYTFKAAHHIYRKAGFLDCPPTIDLPEFLQGKVNFMELSLT